MSEPDLVFKGHGWHLKIRKSAGNLAALDDSSIDSDGSDPAPPARVPEPKTVPVAPAAAPKPAPGPAAQTDFVDDAPPNDSFAAYVYTEAGLRMLGPRGALVLKSLTVLLVICSAILGRALVEGSVVGDFSAARRSATDVPRNILEAENFNRDRARIRWRRTLAWREKEGCDQILEQPHKYFHQIKKHYPHSVHLKDKDGLYTYWERPGGVDVPGLRRDGVNADKLFWHYIWHTEYTWQVIAPEDGAKVTVVQDYGGFTPEKVSMEVLNFVKRAVGMTSEYYPERADKILIVNVPEWYRGVYNILKNFMSKKMLQRIRIFTSSEVQKGALLKYIPAQNLPESYGGKSKLALGESKEEKRMRAYVDKLVKRGGRPRRRRWKQAAEAVEGIAEVATKKPHRRNLWGQLITEDIQPAPPAEEPEEAPRRGFWKQLLRQD